MQFSCKVKPSKAIEAQNLSIIVYGKFLLRMALIIEFRVPTCRKKWVCKTQISSYYWDESSNVVQGSCSHFVLGRCFNFSCVQLFIITRLPSPILAPHRHFELLHSTTLNYDRFWVFGCHFFLYLRDYTSYKLAPYLATPLTMDIDVLIQTQITFTVTSTKYIQNFCF